MSIPALQKRSLVAESIGALLVILAAMLGAQFSHDRIVGSDGFFHIRQAGRVLGDMPWMPLSVFGEGWVDHQLLFHAALAPFAWLLPGVLAAKLGAAVLAGLCLWAIFLFLRAEGAPLPLLFALLPVALSWQLLIRLEMPRAQSMSLALMILGTFALVRDRPWALFGICWLYMWTYHVAVLMLPIAVLHLVVAWLPIGLERRRLPWRGPAAAAAGLLAGLVVHPHSPRTLSFFWQHVVLKVRNAAALPVGAEWDAGGAQALLEMAGGGLAALLVAAVFVVQAARGRGQLPMSSLTLFAVLLAGASTVGTLRSARFLEYSVPLSCVALALTLRDRRLGRTPLRFRAIAPLAVLVAAGLGWSSWRAASAAVSMEPPPDRLEAVTTWLSEADPGHPIVYHFSWNDFPELVFWGPENRYIVGLDPHFLYLADPDLWTLYDRIAAGWGANPSKPLRERFGARWAVLVLPYPGASALLDADPGLRLRYEDPHARLYEVLPPPGM